MTEGAVSYPPYTTYHYATYHTTMPYNVHLDHFFAVLCLFSFTFGILGNVLALSYFLRKKRDVLTAIYINVALVDLFIAILTLPIAISLLDDRSASVFFQHQVFCEAWGILWVVLSRMSVFLAALLSVYRAYYLTFPARVVQKTTICIIGIIIAVGFAVHSVGASIPLWWDAGHYHHSAVASCIGFGGGSIPEQAITATKVFDYLGWIIPVPVVIGSFVVTVLKLSAIRTTPAGGVNERGGSSEQRITVTISIFTGTYLFFNVPAAVVMLLFNFFPHLLWPRFVYLILYAYVMVISLNAACNPAIYLCRMQQMREHVLRACRSCRRESGDQEVLSRTVQSQATGYAKLTNDEDAL